MANPPSDSDKKLWGDARYSDAKILLGQRVWCVHRWIICNKSKYFEGALEGGFFKESKTRVINLNGGKFSEEDIDGLLRFLYFEELDRRQEKDPIATFLVADYFQVAPLRARAEDELISKLNKLIQEGHFAKFKKYSHLVLSQYHDTDLEDIVTRVITDNIKTVMYDSGTWIELTDAYSSLARKVLGLIFPRPTAVTPAKRPASAAFDDTQNPSSPGSKKRHIRRKSGKN